MDIADLGTVTTLPLAEIRPAPDNPRKIGQAAVDVVAKSLAEFGWQQPLVVDTSHVLIAGHTRLLAAKKLGLKQAPVVVADKLSAKQIKAYRIADNRSSDFTSWDFTALTQQLDDLAADFSDVLALADWEAIVTDYEALVSPATDGLVPEAPALEQHGEEDEYAPTAGPISAATTAARPAAFVDDDDDEDDEEDDDEGEFDRIANEQGPATTQDKVTNYLSTEYQLVVICESETAARNLAVQIIDLPGVSDVRNKR